MTQARTFNRMTNGDGAGASRQHTPTSRRAVHQRGTRRCGRRSTVQARARRCAASRWGVNVVIFGEAQLASVLIANDDAASVRTLVQVLHAYAERELPLAASAARRAAVGFRLAMTCFDIESPDMGELRARDPSASASAASAHETDRLDRARRPSGPAASACLGLRATHGEAQRRGGTEGARALR